MRDYLVFLKELRFSGLMPGDYLVTAYAAGTGGEAYPGIIEVVGEGTMGIALAGRYGASLVEGSSHGNAIVTVGSDQQLSVFPDSATDRFLNGVQIQLVPEPGAAFILMLGVLAAVRRR